MSKDKISTQEVVEAIAAQLNISKRAADEFVKTMFTVIEEALMAGETVKIKGFGTFKTQWNAARKSVNVQTGEEFVIDGYYKVSFGPEQGLKDLVNEPFAHLEAIELDKNETEETDTQAEAQNDIATTDEFDGLRIFSEQALEIKDLLAEINALTGPNVILEGDAIERISEEKNEEADEVDENDVAEEDDEIWEEETTNTAEETDSDKTTTVAIADIDIESEKTINASNAEANLVTEATNEVVVIENTEQEADIVAEKNENIDETDANATIEETTEIEAAPEVDENERITNTLQEAVNELEATAEIVDTKTEDIHVSSSSLPESFVSNSINAKNESSPESADKINVASTTQAMKHDENESISASEMLKNTKVRKRIGVVAWIFIILFVLIGAVIGTYLFSSAARCWMRYEMLNDAQRAQFNNMRQSATVWFENTSRMFDKKEKEKAEMPIIEKPKVEVEVENDTIIAPDTTTKVENKSNKTEVDLETLFQQPRVYTTFIAEENVREGSRLTRIAERHLGHRDFWVYIYEANRETIKNPDQLPIGKLIRIPKVDSRLIDPNDPRCIKYARQLHDKYVQR